MTSPDLTFTWDGASVRWIADTDEWTAAELREVEALARGEMAQLSLTSVRGLMVCVSVARATGQRIAQVDAQLTMGRILRIREELDAQDRENRAREAERLAALPEAAPEALPEAAPSGRDVHFTATAVIGADGVAAAGGEVLSPTSAGSEPEGTQPA